jgi:fatty-acid peroxygenase
MYLEVLGPEAVQALGERAEREWEAAVGSWAGRRRVVLFDEAVQVLAASVFPWAGVPSTGKDRRRRAEQLAAVLDGFATPGMAYLRAVRARWQVGRWARRLGAADAGRAAPPAARQRPARRGYGSGRRTGGRCRSGSPGSRC